MAIVRKRLEADTEVDMEIAIQGYMRSYHPYGYGTRVLENVNGEKIQYDDEKKVYFATMSRCTSFMRKG